MENETPAITIITVVFNAAHELEKTIQNIARLDYDNLKYIVIDGGSNGETISIIKKYSYLITNWVSEPDKGIYDAMNKGWQMADPDSYILYLGAGDLVYSLPSDLNRNYNTIFYGNVLIGQTLFKSTHNFKLKLGNTLHHQALLIPKRLHESPPFDLKYKIYADFDFNQRLLKKGVQFKFSKSFVSFALPNGLSATKDENEMLTIVKKNFGRLFGSLAYYFYWMQKLKRIVSFLTVER